MLIKSVLEKERDADDDGDDAEPVEPTAADARLQVAPSTRHAGRDRIRRSCRARAARRWRLLSRVRVGCVCRCLFGRCVGARRLVCVRRGDGWRRKVVRRLCCVVGNGEWWRCWRRGCVLRACVFGRGRLRCWWAALCGGARWLLGWLEGG